MAHTIQVKSLETPHTHTHDVDLIMALKGAVGKFGEAKTKQPFILDPKTGFQAECFFFSYVIHLF